MEEIKNYECNTAVVKGGGEAGMRGGGELSMKPSWPRCAIARGVGICKQIITAVLIPF